MRPSTSFSKNDSSFPISPSLGLVNFDCADITRIVKSLKPSHAIGPDNLNSVLIKACLPDIAPILSKFFALLLSNSNYPDPWRTTFVRPLFKSGSKLDVDNYRPINITSILSRIMEKIIKYQLTSYMFTNKFIIGALHGFTRSKSCDTYLVEFFDHLSTLKDKISM